MFKGETKFSIVQFVHPVTVPAETATTEHVLVRKILLVTSEFIKVYIYMYGNGVVNKIMPFVQNLFLDCFYVPVLRS